MDKRDEFGQLTTYHMKFLKYNRAKHNVENIYNIYLHHHPFKWTSKVTWIPCTTASHLPLIVTQINGG